MFKLLAVVSLCLALAASQSCTDTASLRTLYGFGNTVTSPTVQSGVNYCTSLKNSAVCCTAADMNTIQTKSDNLIANLTNAVITRDKFFVANRNNVLGDLQTSLTSFSTVMTTFASKLALLAVDPSTSQSTLTSFDLISDSLDGVSEAGANLTLAFASLTQDYSGMQSARSTCIVEVVKLQASAWCLACDPNAATEGLDTNTNDIDVSSTVCTRLKNACYNFLNLAQYQNGVLAIRNVIYVINQQTALIQAINNGGTLDPTQFDITSTIPESADLPDGCTSADACDAICNDILDGGMINQANLAAGGAIEDDGDRRRRLAQRMLSGTYDPSDDEAGTTVTFSNDPGNTQFASLSLGSVFAGVMMMISCIFLF